MNAHDQANRLYWESEASVNEIADRLDLSKGALYQMIEPLAAEVDCPDCGAMLEYPNRTALDRGLMQCSTCGRQNVHADDEAVRPSSPPSPGPRLELATTETTVARDPVADRQGLIGLGLLGTAALLWMLRR